METALDNLQEATDHVVAADVSVVPVDMLGSSILRIQTVIHQLKVVQARLVVGADRAHVWKVAGYRSIDAWLAANAKTTIGAARKQRELGEALDQHPSLSDAVDSGALSPDAAAALLPALNGGHTGTSDDVADLIEACTGATPAEARDAGNLFQELNTDPDETDREREHRRRQQRSLKFSDMGDGLTRVDGVLAAPDAEIFQKALRAIVGTPTDGDDRTREQKNADALVLLADAYAKGEVRGGREKPTLIVIIDIEVLEGREPGVGRTSDGTIVPAEIVRRMSTHANIRRLLTSGSVPLDLGRSRRLASDDQYLALVARDGGCRMPGCRVPAGWCEVDHIRDWEDQQGPTDLNLLVLWCVFHHHFRHRPDVSLHGDANDLSITLPDGRTVPLPARGPTAHTHHAAA